MVVDYQEKVFMLARQWEWKFSHDMTTEDHENFRQECKNAEVSTIDVLSQMEEFPCY